MLTLILTARINLPPITAPLVIPASNLHFRHTLMKLLCVLLGLFSMPVFSQSNVTFSDITKASGINFINQSSPEKRFIIESMGGGVAFFDFDNDGKLDIYLVNSYSVEDARKNKPRPPASLYQNLGNGKFVDVALTAGVANPGWAMGVNVADFDNDGFDDLFVTCFGANKLYRNLGNGKFADVTAKSKLGLSSFSTGAAWGDYDKDGRLDLYVSGYVDFGVAGIAEPSGATDQMWGHAASENPKASSARISSPKPLPELKTNRPHPVFWGGVKTQARSQARSQTGSQVQEPVKGDTCSYRGVSVQCGPRGLAGADDHLYHNNGDGTFTDVTIKAGVEDKNKFYGLGVKWTDFDDDGWLDIFVANDATPNYAYRNNHDGTFTEEGLVRGVAVDGNGLEQGCMGVSIGDYDRDGKLDMAISNFADQYNVIYKNGVKGNFSDATKATNTADSSLPFVGWGLRWFDYDNDGWLDLMVANGGVYPQLEGAFSGSEYRQRKLFYRNLRNGTFAEIGTQLGSALSARRVSRGAAWGDFDNDGDLDVIVNEIDGAPSLLRNDSGHTAGNWLMLKLQGTRSNRNAVGAKVTVKAGTLTQVQEIYAGDSYLSHSDWRLHFGFGTAKTIDEIEIKWPNGKIEKKTKIAVNQIMKIIE